MAIDYEAEYNNRRRVPESAEIVAGWLQRSATARAEIPCELDIPYGPATRHRYDLFAPDSMDADTPIVVYIHGGYWQRGERSDYSFVAEALVERGAMVALPSYTLCPEANVATIIDEMKAFLVKLWERFERRAVIVGHSAGGHLAAAMLATDWTRYADAPDDLVRAGYSLSGVFELEPLISTSLNEALRLTPSEARDASPLMWPSPPSDRTFVAAVGGAESSEFLRQSLDLTAKWSAAGLKAECVVVPNGNHFTVVEELARPGSATVERVLQLAQL